MFLKICQRFLILNPFIKLPCRTRTTTAAAACMKEVESLLSV